MQIKTVYIRTNNEKFSDKNLLQKSALSQRQSVSEYILNLIDTPGHVDFNYEVSRSLAAVEGAVLLVDATKGVQAQTLSNLYLAIEQGIEIIPVVNKIDLPNADIAKTKKEIIHILGCTEEDIISASGKTGEGAEKILETVITKIPAPRGEREKPLRALVFDSKYDSYKGVVAYVRVVDGNLKRGDKIILMAANAESTVVEVGYFKPELTPSEILEAGDIGYIATGLKSVSECKVGDTITDSRMLANEKPMSANNVEPLPGYKEVRPMVYASFYPVEGDDYNVMRDALEKLKLNDAAFAFEPESNKALGRGFRCGFLGLLHLEIIQARLQREFNLSPTITTPGVVYKITLNSQIPASPARFAESKQAGESNLKSNEVNIYSASDMPNPSMIDETSEPYVKLDIITPSEYLGQVMQLISSTRGIYKNTEYLDEERVLLIFEAPLTDVIVNFHDDLKSASSGFASMSYELIGYRVSDLIRLDILVAGEKIEAFSRIVPKEKAYSEGKFTVEKLKDAIPRQNFAVALQAAIGAKVIARETITAFRKDVTAKLYGGDISRKKKLLEKQKKGKKKMRNIGKVSIPSEAFLTVLKR